MAGRGAREWYSRSATSGVSKWHIDDLEVALREAQSGTLGKRDK